MNDNSLSTWIQWHITHIVLKENFFLLYSKFFWTINALLSLLFQHLKYIPFYKTNRINIFNVGVIKWIWFNRYKWKTIILLKCFKAINSLTHIHTLGVITADIKSKICRHWCFASTLFNIKIINKNKTMQ